MSSAYSRSILSPLSFKTKDAMINLEYYMRIGKLKAPYAFLVDTTRSSMHSPFERSAYAQDSI